MNRKSLQTICSVVLILLSGVSVFLGSRSLTHASSSSMHAQSLSTSASNNPLPSPSWWNGNCDVNNYPGSYQLSTANYRGLVACGPRNRTHIVHFYPGAWGELEWQ